MDETPKDAELRAIARTESRARRLPADAKCDGCQGREALSPRPDGRILCYECQLIEAGKAPVEADHVAGRANSPLTVPLPANFHRSVTEFRDRNGVGQWPAADGNPLIAVAHFVAGLAAYLWAIATYLKDLAVKHDQDFGSAWWAEAPRCPVVP
jgi:hypothetical protein